MYKLTKEQAEEQFHYMMEHRFRDYLKKIMGSFEYVGEKCRLCDYAKSILRRVLRYEGLDSYDIECRIDGILLEKCDYCILQGKCYQTQWPSAHVQVTLERKNDPLCTRKEMIAWCNQLKKRINKTMKDLDSNLWVNIEFPK